MKVTTLNIGQNTVKYMSFQGNSAITWGTLALEGALKNGLIQDPAVLGGKLRPLFASGKLPREKVICSLNGLPFSYRFFTMPGIEPSELPEALTRMARQEMPLAPEDMYLSWRAYPAEKDERQFLVTGVDRRPVDALIQMGTAAGIRPYLMCLPHISLATLNGRDNAIIIDFEPDYSNITLIVRGIPAGMHTVPSPSPEANLADSAVHLVRELHRMTGFYNSNHPGNPVPPTTTIFLTGELSGGPDILGLIQAKAGYPVEILKELPANTVSVPPEASLASYAINIGNALQDGIISGRPVTDPALVHELNLQHIIAGRTSAKKQPLPVKSLLLGAVLAAGIGALVWGYLTQNQAGVELERLQSRLQQSKQELADMQVASGLATQTSNTIKAMITSTGQLEQTNGNLLNPRDNVADLKTLTQCLPLATTFHSIDLSPDLININGITTSQEQVVNYVRSLEASGAFVSASIIWIDRYESANTGISFLITITR